MTATSSFDQVKRLHSLRSVLLWALTTEGELEASFLHTAALDR